MMQGNQFPQLGPGGPTQGQQMMPQNMPVQQPAQNQQPVTPQERQTIGDFIYPHIVQRYQEHASKIVGVLLDSPQVDTRRLAQDQGYLFDIANQVFQNYVKSLQTQQQPAQNTPTQQ